MLLRNYKSKGSIILAVGLIVLILLALPSCENEDEYAYYSRRIEELTPDTPDSNLVTESNSDDVSADESPGKTEEKNETLPGNTIVYVTKSGKKYHLREDCSGMKAPEGITLDEAVASGYEACKRCQ